jgi:Predicted nucleic acid-binding protein, contains PIN domain
VSDVRYLLDTNILSDLMRHPHGRVAKRLTAVGVETVAVSIVVACELRFGAAKSGAHRLTQYLDVILDQIPALPLEAPAEQHYADIRRTLERAGTPIGPNDLLIAAHARALDLVLVSDNVREFARVPGLVVENWLADAAGV